MMLRQVVTLRGAKMATRVAASLLKAGGAPELVTSIYRTYPYSVVCTHHPQ